MEKDLKKENERLLIQMKELKVKLALALITIAVLDTDEDFKDFVFEAINILNEKEELENE